MKLKKSCTLTLKNHTHIHIRKQVSVYTQISVTHYLSAQRVVYQKVFGALSQGVSIQSEVQRDVSSCLGRKDE